MAKIQYRWGVKILLAAIVQLMFWSIGVIAHMIEFNRLQELVIDHENLLTLIEQELVRKW